MVRLVRFTGLFLSFVIEMSIASGGATRVSRPDSPGAEHALLPNGAVAAKPLTLWRSSPLIFRKITPFVLK
jgi:hypothetical protein